MTDAHVQIMTTVRSSDPPANIVVNNLYFQTSGTPGTADWQSLTDQVKAAFYTDVSVGGANAFQLYAGRGGDIRAYDLADTKPRPRKAESTYTPASWEAGALGPRLLASCLSYYAIKNTPHTRGRIYIGPFTSGAATETVANSIMQQLLQLGKNIYNIQTTATMPWFHCIRSTVLGVVSPVTNYWTNDVWDEMHSREGKEASRLKWP